MQGTPSPSNDEEPVAPSIKALSSISKYFDPIISSLFPIKKLLLYWKVSALIADAIGFKIKLIVPKGVKSKDTFILFILILFKFLLAFSKAFDAISFALISLKILLDCQS